MCLLCVQAVDGQPPSIVFYNDITDSVVFIRALDLQGTTWQPNSAAVTIARGAGQFGRCVCHA